MSSFIRFDPMACLDHPLCSLADGHFNSCDLAANTHILSTILFNAQQSSPDLCTSLKTIALNKCPIYGFASPPLVLLATDATTGATAKATHSPLHSRTRNPRPALDGSEFYRALS